MRLRTLKDWWADGGMRASYADQINSNSVIAAFETLRDSRIAIASKVVSLQVGETLPEASLQKGSFDAGYFQCLQDLVRLAGEPPDHNIPEERKPWEHLKIETK